MLERDLGEVVAMDRCSISDSGSMVMVGEGDGEGIGGMTAHDEMVGRLEGGVATATATASDMTLREADDAPRVQFEVREAAK